MATMKLYPSTHATSDSYIQVTNPTNMYAGVDSDTYARAQTTTNNTTSKYLYLRGFNFSSIPVNATVNSFTVRLSASQTGGATSTSYRPYLCNGTTTITGNCGVITTSLQTLTFTGVTANWSTIKSYGSNFGIRINCRRANRNTASVFSIVGAEIEVDYTESSQPMIKENGVWKNITGVYKKGGGVWVAQTDMESVFTDGVTYVKSN